MTEAIDPSRINAATKAFEKSHANVANAAVTFFEKYREDIRAAIVQRVGDEDSIADYKAMVEMVKNYRTVQDVMHTLAGGYRAMRAHRPTTYEEWLANLSPKERESYESRMRKHKEWLANLSPEDREVYDAEDPEMSCDEWKSSGRE